MATRDKKIGKVLIVDDCAEMRHAIRSMVNDRAEEILEAEDGEAAIAAYLLHKPDWVTMDIAMRPMDGLTAVRKIRSHNPLARIVMITGHDTKAFWEAARQAGATDYVRKDDLANIRDV